MICEGNKMIWFWISKYIAKVIVGIVVVMVYTILSVAVGEIGRDN